jgi:hypothetical protein
MRAVATTLSWQSFALIIAALAAFSWSRLPPVRPGSSGPAAGSGSLGPSEAQQKGMVVELAGFVARLQSLGQGVVRAEISTKAGGTLTWADAIELWCTPSPGARAKYRRPPSSAQLELQERKRLFVPILHARSATSDTLRGIFLVRSIAVLPTPCPHHVSCQPLWRASHHGSERVRETPPFLKGGGRRRFEWTCIDAPGLIGTEVRRSEARVHAFDHAQPTAPFVGTLCFGTSQRALSGGRQRLRQRRRGRRRRAGLSESRQRRAFGLSPRLRKRAQARLLPPLLPPGTVRADAPRCAQVVPPPVASAPGAAAHLAVFVRTAPGDEQARPLSASSGTRCSGVLARGRWTPRPAVQPRPLCAKHMGATRPCPRTHSAARWVTWRARRRRCSAVAWQDALLRSLGSAASAQLGAAGQRGGGANRSAVSPRGPGAVCVFARAQRVRLRRRGRSLGASRLALNAPLSGAGVGQHRGQRRPVSARAAR